MALDVKCDCGKRYRVRAELVGQRVRCKVCSGTFLVVDNVEPLAVAPVVVASQVAKSVPPAPHFSTAPERPARPLDPPDPEDRRRMQSELDYSRRSSKSSASNPGLLRVNYLRWMLAFPKWVIVWHSLFVFSFVLTIFVHWAFAVLILFFAYALHVYWHRVKYQFISGCVNAAQVVSLDPPLIAAVTDLSKGGSSNWLVVKVVRQPLSRMAGGMPPIDQRVATASYYNQINSELDHWDDFEPVLTDCVTSNRNDLARVLASIDQEDWEDLQTGLAQIPTPPQPGLTRIYTMEEVQRPIRVAAADSAMLINRYLNGKSYCHLAAMGIKPDVMHQAQSYVPAAVMAGVVALVESSRHSTDAKDGMALTSSHVLYRFGDNLSGSFQYIQMVGAFLGPDGLELGFKSGERLLLPSKHFMRETEVALELLFNAIVRAK